MSATVEILRLGHAGDGVTADGVFVPYGLPGDIVKVDRIDDKRARLVEIVTPSPHRIEPACRHFTRCGGCAVQQAERGFYLAWKREQVIAALAQRGFADVQVDEMRAVKPGTRRRASFKLKGTGKGAELGFYEPESRTLVDLLECPILDPKLAALMPRLRAEMGKILNAGETAEAFITLTDTGEDCALKLKRARGPDILMDLGAMAEALDLARLSWNGELLALRRAPRLAIGGVEVSLPQEAFLQPTREGEAMLQSLVAEGIGEAKPIADLFAGLGTFALALAKGRKILAAEAEGPMIAALAQTAHAAKLAIQTQGRDLFRNPLEPDELDGFEAVVIDPPRPGAKAQSERLARSKVRRIVYVSCSPASFARDARILAEGGYGLKRVSPVDQFVWSSHIELVAVFDKSA